jgi:hypothetical protein
MSISLFHHPRFHDLIETYGNNGILNYKFIANFIHHQYLNTSECHFVLFYKCYSAEPEKGFYYLQPCSLEEQIKLYHQKIAVAHFSIKPYLNNFNKKMDHLHGTIKTPSGYSVLDFHFPQQ